MKFVAHCCLTLLLFGGVAQADILHLQNGRTLEGRVVKKARGVIRLEVAGGVVQVPVSTVKRIERRRTPQQEYALRARRTDMSDPIALDALAFWASKRGLGEQAIQLQAQAEGIRLQDRVDAIRGTRRAQDFVGVYHWARQAGYSETVQRWLLAEALEIDAEDVGARRALKAMAEAEEAREIAHRKRADDARCRAEAREEALEKGRVSELEEKLAEQKTVSDELRDRLEEIERKGQAADAARHQARVRRRRRRNRGVVLVAPRVVEEPPSVSNTVVHVPAPSSRFNRTPPRARIFPR